MYIYNSEFVTLLRYIQIKFLMVETIFNLAKVNTVPCMFTAALSLG